MKTFKFLKPFTIIIKRKKLIKKQCKMLRHLDY